MPEQSQTSTEAKSSAEGGNPLLRAEPGLAIWTFVTFAILLVILKKVAWGPMLELLDRREKAIQDSLAEAEKARAAAASQAEEQNRILAEARRDAQALLAASRSDAERMRDEIVARAKSESEKVVAAGREAIEMEKRTAIQEIRTTAVDLALGASAKLLRARIDDAKSRELIASYVKEIETGSGRGAKA